MGYVKYRGESDTVGINDIPGSFKPTKDPSIYYTFIQQLLTRKEKN